MSLNSAEEIIEDIRRGRMVILIDDEDRENEGDLIMAASAVRPEDINFMATHGRGLICLTLTRERCEQLQLPLMVRDNAAPHGTAFTVSIEAAEGVTTGISAADRATTIRAAVAPHARPSDLVQPGHIFPLMAQPGGVLTRAGHTEAGCDLARLAGGEAAAVIVEVLKEDGTMARRPDLEVFAGQHGLKIGTIADLIHYRTLNEKTVECVGSCDLPTRHGDFTLHAYQDSIDDVTHLALVMGDIAAEEAVLVRVHVQDTLCDLTMSRRSDCGWPLDDVMGHIAKEGKGVLVVLRHHESPAEIINRVRRYRADDLGEEHPIHEKKTTDLRTYGIGAQILADVGVRRMRVLSAPRHMRAISGFGLEIVEYVTE